MAAKILTILLIFFIVTESAWASKSKKEKKTVMSSSNQKLPMKQSKEDITKILKSFDDKEGAMISVIRFIKNDNYQVEVISKTKKCMRHEVEFLGQERRISFGGIGSCG